MFGKLLFGAISAIVIMMFCENAGIPAPYGWGACFVFGWLIGLSDIGENN